MSELEFEERIDKLREYWMTAQTDANKSRDALRNILKLCDENRRGIVSEIETIALRALGGLA